MELINREDAIKAIEEHGKRLSRTWGRKYTKAHEAIVLDCIGALKDIPSAEPKQGKWIRKESWSRGVGMGEVYGWYFECSACGCLSEGSVYDAGNFCPNCGADMRKGAD